MILNLPCSNADEGIGVEWYRGGVRTSALENPLWPCALPIDAPPEVTVTGICPLPYQKTHRRLSNVENTPVAQP
jgi:hypothetical protein